MTNFGTHAHGVSRMDVHTLDNVVMTGDRAAWVADTLENMLRVGAQNLAALASGETPTHIDWFALRICPVLARILYLPLQNILGCPEDGVWRVSFLNPWVRSAMHCSSNIKRGESSACSGLDPVPNTQTLV